MLFEHQVFHTLHDKLGASIHHSGEQSVGMEFGGVGGGKEK